MSVVVLVEHDRGTLVAASEEALTLGRALAAALATACEAVTIGAAADGLAADLARTGVAVVHQAHHEALADYGPEVWADALASLVTDVEPAVVLACGTDRGQEVLAGLAARLDLPFVANVVPDDLAPGTGRWALTRVRWGGSLLERTTLDATGPVLLTSAPHAVEPVDADAPGDATPRPFPARIDPASTVTVVRDRVERESGVTLATAAVVVGGGRGVGRAEGFAPLEELAAELGGMVGCSRAVTNNGWRNHTDQVGQTGTRIGADVYLACGISGAIQHWVGASGAQCIIAVNTDREANMVTRADYAVIGDLHEVIPAVTAEIRRRRSA